MNQAELLLNCKQNDRKSQLKLYNTYCDGMFVVAKRYLKNSNLAEEAMQDAFVKAFKNLSQFKGEVSFGAWLKRIVINQCFDLLKKNELQTISIEDHLIDNLEEESWNVNSDVNIRVIKDTMDLLPVKYKSILQLYLMDGFDHKEIAEFMGIVETTSRSLLFRGKKMLQEELKSRNYGTRS